MSNASRPLKVLLVEDVLDMALPLTHMLSSIHVPAPIHVEHVQSLKDAVARLGQSGVDAVLLDLGLPDSNGVDTCRALHEAVPGVAIVVLTVVDDEQVALESLRYGAQDYAVKGEMDIKALARVIRHAVERKQLEGQLRQSHWELEQRVQQRTAELTEEKKSLEQMNRLMMGREERIIELKREVDGLLKELGRAPRYGI